MTLTFFKLKRVTKLGVKSLIEHKLRSLLTALGIIFGVASVIAMLAIGEGASYEARRQIQRMGSRNVIVKSRKPPSSSSAGAKTKRLSEYGLTFDDALRIHQIFPQVRILVPARIIPAKARRETVRIPVRVIGTVPWYGENATIHRVAGRFIVDTDVRYASNACVLSESAARKLFPLTWPIGRSIYLDQNAYVVVGIVRELTGAGKQRQHKTVDSIYISIASAKKRFGEIIIKRETGNFSAEKVELHELIVTAPSETAVIPLANAIRTLLKRFHKRPDFEITVPLELLKQAEATKRIFNIVLGSIAGISLLVGGIGIMNIMLANVTERTREIGIRRALGATRADITLQFLAEALILSLTGGIIGIALGLAIPGIVSHFAGLRTIVTPHSLVLAFSISVVTGIIFGIYPATRAAALSPIEALRHE